MAKSLQDKVIIVTGAGRGIGREIALLCAAEGAKVVVNDPGGAADGSGNNAAPAEEVVEEIRKRGGTAVANFETVAEAIPANHIVKMATDHFLQARPFRRHLQLGRDLTPCEFCTLSGCRPLYAGLRAHDFLPTKNHGRNP